MLEQRPASLSTGTLTEPAQLTYVITQDESPALAALRMYFNAERLRKAAQARPGPIYLEREG
jgi:hypothetical protein